MSKLRYTIFVLTIFVVLALSAVNTVPALADDATPPPADTTTTVDTPPTNTDTTTVEAPPADPATVETPPAEVVPTEMWHLLLMKQLLQ